MQVYTFFFAYILKIFRRNIYDVFDTKLILKDGLFELRYHAAVIVPAGMENRIPLRTAIIRTARRRHICRIYQPLFCSRVFFQISNSIIFIKHPGTDNILLGSLIPVSAIIVEVDLSACVHDRPA